MARIKYRSEAFKSAHMAALGLFKIGAIDAATMGEFDNMCLTPESAAAVQREAPQKPWLRYEQVAQHLLNDFADKLGMSLVEKKQALAGMKSGAGWELDAKGVLSGGDGFMIVECKRYPSSKVEQSEVAALAYQIRDTGAAGGIIVTPLGLQEGARKIAKSDNIIEATLDADSTASEYVMRFLHNVFVGKADQAIVQVNERATVRVFEGDPERHRDPLD